MDTLAASAGQREEGVAVWFSRSAQLPPLGRRCQHAGNPVYTLPAVCAVPGDMLSPIEDVVQAHELLSLKAGACGLTHSHLCRACR